MPTDRLFGPKKADSQYPPANGISIDGDDVYITGWFNGTANFGDPDNPLESLLPFGKKGPVWKPPYLQSDIFVSKS